MRAQRRKCFFTHVSWFSFPYQRLGADAGALEIPRGKRGEGQVLLNKHTAVNSKRLKLAI